MFQSRHWWLAIHEYYFFWLVLSKEMSGRMKDEDARKDCLFKDPVELEKGSTSIKLSKNEIGIWSTLHTLSALFYSHAPPIPHPNTQNSPDPLLLDTEKEKSGGVDDIHSGDESMLNNSSSWYHRSKNPFVLELLPCYNPPDRTCNMS